MVDGDSGRSRMANHSSRIAPEGLARGLRRWLVGAAEPQLVPLPLGVPTNSANAAADLPELAGLVTPRDDHLPPPGAEGPDAVPEPPFSRHRRST